MAEHRDDRPSTGATLERSFHDPAAGDSTSTAVALAVGRAKDVPATELPQLEATLDTDALDRLVSSLARRDGGGDGRISFRYTGVSVEISFSGEVVVREAAPD